NSAPVLTGVPISATIDEEVAYSFTAVGTDHDIPAQTVTYSLSGAPAGASINSSGDFTWTPTEAQGGSAYTFNVIASDGSLSDTKSVTLTVAKVNSAPTLSGVPTSITIDEMAIYTFTASGSDHDLPGDALTFSLSGAPSGASIGA